MSYRNYQQALNLPMPKLDLSPGITYKDWQDENSFGTIYYQHDIPIMAEYHANDDARALAALQLMAVGYEIGLDHMGLGHYRAYIKAPK